MLKPTAVLDALVPAVIQRQGAVSVIVSPAAWDEAGQLRSANHRALADAGATFLAVDIAGSDMETLAGQFSGFTTVINCMGFVAGPGTQLKITRAVLAAGVPRYFPWQFGVNYNVVGKGSGQPVWDEQYDVRTLLRAQRATEWVIVSTGMFTSFLFEPDFDVVNLSNRTLHALGSWDTQVTVTSPADIGSLTTAIYLHQPRIVNEVVFVAGSATRQTVNSAPQAIAKGLKLVQGDVLRTDENPPEMTNSTACPRMGQAVLFYPRAGTTLTGRKGQAPGLTTAVAGKEAGFRAATLPA
mgnify:CR=1 FL=1